LGVWDTVGALGIPARYKLLSWINKKHDFHDTALSEFVRRARHAVAIDERRKDFQPTLWDNLEVLNKKANADPAAADAPYQQVWFPGVHSAVGGGGERRGLSDQALDWILDGARAAGLLLDGGRYLRIFELQPDYRERIENSEEPGALYKVMNKLSVADRTPGPEVIHEVSVSARRRWLERPENLKDRIQYRPATLGRVMAALGALDPAKYGLGGSEAPAGEFDLYEVKRGDTLTAIAKSVYGNANQFARILEANLDKIDNPDRIYPGMILRIPK
jgi:uncharacterized protein (DUF2235 family)